MALSVWCCQNQLVCAEEGVKMCVMEVFLLAGTAVRCRPQVNWVSGEFNGLEASRENSHYYGRQQ